MGVTQQRPSSLLTCPAAPQNTVAGKTVAGGLLGWEPEVKREGLHRTTDWCISAEDTEKVRTTLDRMPTER